MHYESATEALNAVIEEATQSGAEPGDGYWQARIDLAWRRAMDAGVRCHIREPGGTRWVVIYEAGSSTSARNDR